MSDDFDSRTRACCCTPRPVNKLLTSFALKIHSPRMAYVGITLLAGFFALFSWGIGLIVPAVVAQLSVRISERGIKVDYPLLVACGYSGTAVGMQGLSASIQLILNTPDHFLIEKIGLIPLDQTIFSTWSVNCSCKHDFTSDRICACRTG